MADTVITVLEADGTTQTDVTINDNGREAATGSKPVALCTEDKTALDAILTTAALRSSTGTFSSVNSATSSTTILASNANRKGAVIVNTDANTLYVDTSGGTAATTRYSYALAQNAVLEVPFGYSGLITGIWSGDGSGAALVTEFT